MEVYADVPTAYLDFARSARGASPCFEQWAGEVAADPELCAWLAGLPPRKRQPNLVFAAARWHGVPAPGPYAGLRSALLDDDDGIRSTILARATQTNEVGRLATLVPVFAQIAAAHGAPLSLVELGASAGLCLFPDRYDYRWSDGSLGGSGGPVLSCTSTGPVPVPARHPAVAARVGIDLDPRDVDDADQMAWLEILVWPEQEERRERLRAAIEVTRADPPALIAGDLLTELPAVVRDAGRHGVPVVYHSAVLVYLEPARRREFTATMAGLVSSGCCHWVSNESPAVLPEVDVPAAAAAAPDDSSFLLGLDGRGVGWAHGHGASLRWA